jgi:uncharacterized protein YifN (PemK superfamily)
VPAPTLVGAKIYKIMRPNSRLVFVKKNRILMCRFESCWDVNKNSIAQKCAFISNIKPEIGKDRPVVVIYAHKRAKLAMIVPFTTQRPAEEITNTLYIPVGIMPGVLSRKECWVLCDMIQTVSIDRLHYIYLGTKDSYRRRLDSDESFLPDNYFKQIIDKIHKLVG